MSERQPGQPTSAERRLGQLLAPATGDHCLEAPVLLALASGSRTARTPQVQDHLSICPRCRGALRELASLEDARGAAGWSWLKGYGALRPLGGLALAAAVAAITLVAVRPGQPPSAVYGPARDKVASAPRELAAGQRTSAPATLPSAGRGTAGQAAGPPRVASKTGADGARRTKGQRIVVALAYGPAVPGDAYMENGEVVPGLSRGEPEAILKEASAASAATFPGIMTAPSARAMRDDLAPAEALGTKSFGGGAGAVPPVATFGASPARLLKPDPGNATVAPGTTTFESHEPVRLSVSLEQLDRARGGGEASAAFGMAGGLKGGGAGGAGPRPEAEAMAKAGKPAVAGARGFGALAKTELRQDLAPGMSYRVDLVLGAEEPAHTYRFRALTDHEALLVREAASREGRTPVAAAILYYRAGRYADAVRTIRTAPPGRQVDRLKAVMEARLARRLADPAVPVEPATIGAGSPAAPLPR